MSLQLACCSCVEFSAREFGFCRLENDLTVCLLASNDQLGRIMMIAANSDEKESHKLVTLNNIISYPSCSCSCSCSRRYMTNNVQYEAMNSKRSRSKIRLDSIRLDSIRFVLSSRLAEHVLSPQNPSQFDLYSIRISNLELRIANCEFEFGSELTFYFLFATHNTTNEQNKSSLYRTHLLVLHVFFLAIFVLAFKSTRLAQRKSKSCSLLRPPL